MNSVRHFALALAAAMAMGTGVARANEGDNRDAAARVVEKFHAALKHGNAAEASALLASTAVIYESGHAESRAAYLAHHLAADIAFAKDTERVVKSSQQQCSASLCILMQTSETAGKYKGKEVFTKGVETTVLQHDGQAWKIVHVHWSSRK